MPELLQEGALHQSLVFGGDLFRGDSVHAVGVIAHPDEQGSEEDGHVEAVSLLPLGHIGGAWNALRELIGRVQLLVLHVLAYFLGAVYIVMEFEEAQFGGPYCGTDELVHVALVLGVQVELPHLVLFVHVLLELLLILYHVLQHQLFLWGVLPIGQVGSSVRSRHHIFEVSASLPLLINDEPALALVLGQQGVVVELRVHQFQIFKYKSSW